VWDAARIAEAEALLAAASRAGVVGRFQLEAAIQSAHAARARTGRTDWAAIAALYDGLVRLAPTVGAFVARAAAIGGAHGADAGLAALGEVPGDAVMQYQPYWAVRASLLRRAGRDAASAYERAIALAGDPAVRAYLAGEAEG
jgi:RNA polymerase sigma-70 factor (ECF subfamily)